MTKSTPLVLSNPWKRDPSARPDICIYWLNGCPEIREQALAIGISNLAISSITVAELYFGAYNSTRVVQNLEWTGQFVGAIAKLYWLTYTLEVVLQTCFLKELDFSSEQCIKLFEKNKRYQFARQRVN